MYVCVPFFVACENFAGRRLVVAAQRLLPSQGGHAHQQWDFSMIRVLRYVFCIAYAIVFRAGRRFMGLLHG
jgi:hypothetical protein